MLSLSQDGMLEGEGDESCKPIIQLVEVEKALAKAA